MPHDRAYTRLTKLEVDTLVVGTSVTLPGGSSASAGDFTVTGKLIFSTAAGKIVPGATSLSIRNTGDTASNLSITDAGVSTFTGATVGNAQVIVTSTNAAALAVGRQGGTAPALQVDASTASSATGVKITAAAAAGGVAVAAISSGTDEAMTINAKGTGTLTLNNTATGNIVLGRAATGVSLSVTGAVTTNSGTAVAAPAGAAAAFLSSSTALLGIWWVNATPNTQLTAAKGSIAFATNGSSGTTRAFINTDGATAWTAVNTVA